MVSEQQNGDMLAFSIYTGSKCNELVQRNATMDPSCSIITKTVMGLLDSGNLLDVADVFGLINGSTLLNSCLKC